MSNANRKNEKGNGYLNSGEVLEVLLQIKGL